MPESRSASAQTPFVWGVRTYVMGIINATPDSFSGDGLAGRPADAMACALRMAQEGADVIDIGGQSTRPGHVEVGTDEEIRRVKEVLPELAGRLDVPISIDAYRFEVAEAAIAAGAVIINDVWGLRREPRLAQLAAATGSMLIVMHNRAEAIYQDLMAEVIADLRWSVATALDAGVSSEHLIIDPGIGFGKTPAHNLEILRRLSELRVLELPILLGTSRKSVIGKVLDLPADERIEGTAATVALGIANGVDMVRVHDVKEMVRVVRMSDAIVRGG